MTTAAESLNKHLFTSLFIILCVSLCPCLCSVCPADATQSVVLSVIEDRGNEPDNHNVRELVYDFSEADLIFFLMESETTSQIFSRYFELMTFIGGPHSGDLTKIRWIDREEIARTLGDTYSPVVLNFDLIYFEYPFPEDDAIALCKNVTINIVDLDDNSPYFDTNPVNATSDNVTFADDNTAVGTKVRLPDIEDHDEGVNGTSFYELTDPSGKFALELQNYSNTPRVRRIFLINEAPLDFEEQESYQLSLTIREGNQNPEQNVLIINVEITDDCDEEPEFISSRYTPSISENSTQYTHIVTVNATDEDNPNTCPLSYSISEICQRQTVNQSPCTSLSSDDYPFTLDSESGVLSLTRDLDRERTAEYEVTIEVSDMMMSASAVIAVTVEDVNDNDPVIGNKNIVPSIFEDHPVNESIGRFTVDDADTGPNGEVIVTLYVNSSGTETLSDLFQLRTVSNNNYEIFNSDVLDYERQRQHHLVIRLHDNGNPTRYNFEAITINIMDRNDHTPVFQPTITYPIQENSGMGTTAATVNATDADSGANGEVHFSLPDNTSEYPHQDLFHIDSEVAGNILVSEGAVLDYEVRTNYTILVRAKNPVPHSPVTDEEVTIFLVNVNDNMPSISDIPPFRVRESESSSHEIGTVPATDADNLNPLTYTLVPTDGHSLFSLTPYGVLVLVNDLDYEEDRSHNLTVEVSDGHYTTSASIIITVIGENDEIPTFGDALYLGTVIEEVNNAEILTVIASDRDEPAANTTLTYYIVEGAYSERFRIDPSNGTIYTAQALDREDVSKYTLLVLASDGQRNSTMKPVSVQVLDINDHTPEFLIVPYIFSLVENAALNTTVGTVSVLSLDEGSNQDVIFEITDGNANGRFSIDAVSGEIKAHYTFNHETDETRIHLTVKATDQGVPPRYNMTQVVVTITDENDNPPEFSLSRYIFTLREDYPIGQVFGEVVANDLDGAGNNVTRYSFSDDSQSDTSSFRIAPFTGELSLVNSLDFETVNMSTFIVSATDNERGDYQTFTTVVINITNARDLNLTFPPGFSTHFTVVENVEVNHEITRVEVTDNNNNSISRLIYTLTTLDHEPSPHFNVREVGNTGIIYTITNSIDREAPDLGDDQIYELILNVSDPDTSTDSYGYIVGYINIEVLDENDNSPRFTTPTQTHFDIVENGNSGDLVGTFEIMDPDAGSNGSLRLNINGIVPFTVTPVVEGRLYQVIVASPIDREEQNMYELNLVAVDMGTPSRNQTLLVTVNITDVNDNAPVFCENPPADEICEREVDVREDLEVQGEVATVRATDADYGSNAEITYEFLPGNLGSLFNIDSNTGRILLGQSLNLEEGSEVGLYTIEIKAEDGGGLSSIYRLIIRVDDVNEFAPQFTNVSFTTNIPENYPFNVPFTSLRATDRDIHPNSVVKYALADNALSRIFKVNRDNGEISIDDQAEQPSDCPTINYERTNEYKVDIIAYDLGVPRMYNTKTLTVQIENVNEHTPQFDVHDMIILMSENTNVGTVVLEIEAYDNDFSDDLVYTLSPANSIFSWDGTSNLFLSREVDYDTLNFTQVTLEAYDGEYRSSITIDVIILNENNHDPIFTTPVDQPIAVSESTQPGTSILSVHASDADNATSDAVEYSISSGNVDGKFYINPKSGVLYVAQYLDYESDTRYELTIIATDTGAPTRTSSPLEIVVEVENENDEVPQFEHGSYTFTLVENNVEGATAGCVQANDRDVGDFGITIYSIVDEGAKPGFFVLENECILALRTIDREKDSEFSLTVEAQDQASPSATATVDITVIIGDLNDNGPEFSKSLYLYYIEEDHDINQPLGTVMASDRDNGVNASFTYDIVSQSPNPIIALDPQNGQVTLATSIPSDYESSYTVVVRAMSAVAGDDRSSNATVIVVIESESDHHPKFTSPPYERNVSENFNTGHSIFDVSRVVNDEDGNSGLTYSFVEDYAKFALDSETGLLTLSSRLNFEDERKYVLRIKATDPTSRSATATLTVNVEDENDHKPIITPLPSILHLSPIPYTNIQLFTVEASDEDDGAQGTVGFSLIEQPSGGRFEIDSRTGIVTNKISLVGSDNYTFVIRAYDHGSPLKSSNITVNIHIHENTDTPQFPSGASVNNEVPEDKDIITDQFVREFTTEPLAESFHLVYSNASSGTFSIDTQNRLVLNSQLDYEKTPQYLLIIEARSISNGLRLSSFLLVNIIVTDVNDNPPYFQDIATQSITESSSPGIPVFTAVAMDDDSGTNAQINYAITGGSIGSTFIINQSTGEVTLAKLLDRERTSTYTLTIRATDNGVEPMQSETTVTIEVEDVNDNAPRFGQTNYTVSVYENPHSHIGDSVIQIIATDADIGSLNYYIELLEGSYAGTIRTVSSDTFSIHFDTGNITLHRNINREEVDRYFLKVEAKDTEEQHTAVAYLTVHVLDINDNSPEFLSTPGRQTIKELTHVNTLILSGEQLNVIDRDSGRNGIVKYSLGEGWPQGFFKINPWTGALRVASTFEFNKEGKNIHTVTILVEDQGVPARTAEISFEIAIQDVNNHPPIINNTNLHFEISVNHAENEPIERFTFSDEHDELFNILTLFRIPDYYNISKALFKFDGDSTDDTLKLRRALTNQDIGEYTFQVEAIQQSSNPYCPQYIQAAYAPVVVIIHKANNVAPEFQNNKITYEILETVTEGTRITINELKATDSDGNSISYKILTPNVPFAIVDSSSHEITITSPLDADAPATSRYELIIQASDDGFPVKNSSANLTIVVLNANDIPPKFKQESYTGTILENSENGFPVLSVSVEDGDTDSSSLSYTIKYPQYCNSTCFPFEVDSSGEIKTISVIDYEQRASYSFEMEVSDGVHTTRVPVTINVIGENEHQPIFKSRIFNFTTDENNFLVGRIEAVDEDGGLEGSLVYSFSDTVTPDYDILLLNETSGEIFLLDRQQTLSRRKRDIVRGSDNIVTLSREVTVRDLGSEPESDSAKIQVFFEEAFFNKLVGETSTATPTTTNIPYEIIIIVVVAVVAAIVLFLSIIIIAYLCRRHTKNKKFKVEDAHMNDGSEMTERYCPNGNIVSLDSKNTDTKIHTGNSASGSERSYSGMADDEMESGNERYAGTSPHLPNKPLHSGSSRVRSTSDLASSVGTDALQSQTNEHPYTKAQLMRIYANNEGLLDDTVSHDSVHMFGSEGGGEVDGELDINNIIYQKINDLEDDEESTTIMDDDASTTYSKGLGQVLTGSVSNMEPDDREDPLAFTSNPKGWIPPNVRAIEQTIDEITGIGFASQEEPLPRRHGYDLGPYSHSQGASLYNPSATQESFIGIQHLPKLYKDHKPQDYSRRYYPEEHHERMPREREPDHHRPRYQTSQRYGSASVLPDYHHHNHHHHHHPQHHPSPHNHSSNHHRVPGSRSQQHYRSQDLGQQYNKYSPYTPGGRRPHPNTYMTPTEGTDGTVTPHTALNGDYHYLSSSSTSLTSTNVSGNLSQPSRPSQIYH